MNDDGEAVGDGRIWVWGDGEENGLANVKKSWEALEYEPSDSGSDTESDGESDSEEEDNEDDEDEENDDDDEGEEDEESGAIEGEASERRRKRRKGSTEEGKKKRRREDGDDRVSLMISLRTLALTTATAPTPCSSRRTLRPDTTVLRIRDVVRHVGRANTVPAGDGTRAGRQRPIVACDSLHHASVHRLEDRPRSIRGVPWPVHRRGCSTERRTPRNEDAQPR